MFDGNTAYDAVVNAIESADADRAMELMAAYAEVLSNKQRATLLRRINQLRAEQIEASQEICAETTA